MSLWNSASALDSVHGFASRTTNRVALTDGMKDVTYGELAAGAEDCAAALTRAGCYLGDRIAIMSENRVELIPAILAVHRAGCSAGLVHYRSTPDEITSLLRLMSASFLLVSREASSQVGPLPLMPRGSWGPFNIYGLPTEDARPPMTEITWLLPTGGTTGAPKLAVIPWRNFVLNVLAIAHQASWSSTDTAFVGGTLSHGLPFTFAMGTLTLGGQVILQRQFAPRAALGLMNAYGATWLPTVPTMIRDFLACGEPLPESLKTIFSGGAKLSAAEKIELCVLLPSASIMEYYGASEAGYFSLWQSRADMDPASNGKAMLGVRLSVRNEDGVECEEGEIGRIWRAGMPWAENVWGLESDGWGDYRYGEWVSAGDLGLLKGQELYIVGREKDVVVSGGVNVYTLPIEDVLRNVPGVSDIAIIGLPDEKWGEAVTAVVVPESGVDHASVIDALMRRADAALANFKRPKTWHVRESLPRTPAGKVLKRQLVADITSDDGRRL